MSNVKAHQDRAPCPYGLSRAAQLNIKADRLASDFPTSGYIKQCYYHPPSAVNATLFINSVPIMSKYKECLRHHIHAKDLQEYVQNKWVWSESVYNNIWWNKAHSTALKLLSHSDGQKIQKFNYYRLPTNRRLSKFHVHINNHCPCCPTEEETNHHILWCNSDDRLTAKHIWENDVFQYLSDMHTRTDVWTALMLGFHHWIYHKPVPPLLQFCPTASPTLQKAYSDQTRIGWNHFARGRISLYWKQLIALHLQTKPPPDPIEVTTNRRRNQIMFGLEMYGHLD